MTQLHLTARAYHRVLKLARTIADLAGSEDIQSVHLAKVLHLRSSKVDDEIKDTFLFARDVSSNERLFFSLIGVIPADFCVKIAR